MSNRSKWFTFLIGSTLIAGLALAGIAAIGVVDANAQANTPEISGELPYDQNDSEFSHGRGGRGPIGPLELDEYLAQALNISVEELQEARDEARQKAIDQALEDGKLTAEQAEMMKAQEALKKYIDKNVLIAKALGIDSSELEEALADGKRLPELLEEFGVDPAEFREAMQTAFEEAVQQAVTDGAITQEQADQMLSGDPSQGGFHGPSRPGSGRNFGPGGFPPHPIPGDQDPVDTGSNL